MAGRGREKAPGVSLPHIIQAGTDLFIGKDEAYIMNRRREKSALRKEGDVYVLDLFVKEPPSAVAPSKYMPVESFKLQTEENQGDEGSMRVARMRQGRGHRCNSARRCHHNRWRTVGGGIPHQNDIKNIRD